MPGYLWRPLACHVQAGVCKGVASKLLHFEALCKYYIPAQGGLLPGGRATAEWM
jgi:hypothetical protein